MKKMILALCAVATLSIAVISCSKKDDSNDSTTTTASTTATTSTTGITPRPRPIPTKNTLVIDTNTIGYTVSSCGSVSQDRWAMKAAKTSNLNIKFEATLGTLQGFTTTYAIAPTLPATGAQGAYLALQLDSGFYTAASGIITMSNDTAGKTLTFTDIKFTKTGQPDVLVSGKLSCQ
jgi:hypothetical protein